MKTKTGCGFVNKKPGEPFDPPGGASDVEFTGVRPGPSRDPMAITPFLPTIAAMVITPVIATVVMPVIARGDIHHRAHGATGAIDDDRFATRHGFADHDRRGRRARRGDDRDGAGCE
jgi:hypothetical protein